MAQYKVLQDIEAEDKLLGPLSLRQFIYAVIVIVLGFVAYRLLLIKWFLAIPFLPPMVFFGLLAAPLGGQQSSEVWLLAKIKFFVFPKKRIWDQDGAQELVTITAPKQVEQHLTKEFSQDEVKSRLKALASTLDTKGWAIRNAQPSLAAADASDRLIDISSLPQNVPSVDVRDTDDVLDPTANPVAQQMDQMISQTEQQHRQELLDKMHSITQKQQVPTKPPTIQAPPPPQPQVTQRAPVTQEAQRLDIPTKLAGPSPKTEPNSATQNFAAPISSAPASPPKNQSSSPMTDSDKTDTLKEVKQGSKQPGDVSLHGDNSSSEEVVVSLH